MCRHGAKQAERACTSVRVCWERAYGRKATADKGVRGPQGQSVLLATATRSLAPQVRATAPPADRSPQRPTWRPVGSLPRESIAPPPPSSVALRSLPAPLSPDPPPFPLRDRDGRGHPPPPLAALRGPVSCGPEEPRAGDRTCAGCRRSGGTSRFPVTRSPRRKGRDEARLFLCRLPGSTCAACGFLVTRGPRPGLALPAACLELDRSGLGRQAGVRA